MKIENHHAEEEKTSERSVKVLLSGMFTRKKKEKKKKRSSPPNDEDSRLMMRRDKSNKNMHMSLSEMMRKLKHSFKKEKPQNDNKKSLVLGKNKGRSLTTTTTTTKDHFFLERMTSISQKRHQQEQKHNLSSDQNLGTSEEYAQRKMVSLLPGYSSPFRSPGKIWDQNPTLLSRSASDDFIKSETLAEIEESDSLSQDSSPSVSSSSHNFVTFEISQLEASHVEKDDESSREELESLPQPSLLSADSPSHYISRTEEYELVLERLFIQYEISPSRGEAKRETLCNQFEERDVPMDEKETVFKYVKAVLDAIDSSWEDMYLKTEFSDQILNLALFNNIPFSPSQLCAAKHNHYLLFESINELIFEFCRFPQWVSFVKPMRTQVLSFGDESIVQEVQKEVYCRLFPAEFAESVDQIMREDMEKRRNWWLDVRCEVECTGFETSELILNELLEQLILDL